MTLTRAGGVTVSEMEGDLFLVKPESGEIYHLDPMAAAIWNAAEAGVSRRDLLVLFQEAFPDEPAERLSQDIGEAVTPLLEAALLVETGPD